ncbi:hypothetical protein SAY86_023264 [Trapa natans]|uniref:Zinc beta-ribbon domain-containing protein n=1 Tax=Trapa natans TaxID=22666 RepID=A0AAN7R5M8_TRANT|nr:hypothetical protein SAY86_023264 [Trapa natans]
MSFSKGSFVQAWNSPFWTANGDRGLGFKFSVHFYTLIGRQSLLLNLDRDDALHAKEIAERKLMERDYADKSKRVTYNQKRNSRVVQQSSNGFYQNKRSKNFSNNRVNVPSAPSQHCQKNDTFWTICNQCKTHYEYLGVHLSHTLLCPNCKQAFYPAEKAPPSHDLKPSNSHSKQMTVLLGSSWLTSLLLAILTGQDIFIMVLQKGEEWKTVFIKHIILGLIKWAWEMEVIQKGIKPWEHMDPNEVRRIPREEMLRFSHQVPGHLLTGQEAQHAPKGCWELNPAAMHQEGETV